MNRLVLVRHSQPEIEPEKPASSWRLGEIGRRGAELLADRLGDFSPAVVWSSREPKAVETAEIVAAAFGVPVRIADGLEEHHRDDVPYFPAEEEFEVAVERLFARPDKLVLGTETANQALRRFTAAIDRIIEAGQADNIVVTHGTVVALYAASVAGVEPTGLWRRLDTPSFVVLGLPGLGVRFVVKDVTVEQG